MIINKIKLSIATVLFSLALPTFASDVELVSVDMQNNGYSLQDSTGYTVSADGRFVVFTSAFENDNTPPIISFLRDRQTGITNPMLANSQTWDASASMSADGRHIVYNSLTPDHDNPDNNLLDINLHDTQTGSTKLVSVNSEGEPVSGSYPVVSLNGRYVGFTSDSTNLAEHTTQNSSNGYIHDTLTGKTTLVSKINGMPANSFSPVILSISGNARFVAFVAGDANTDGSGEHYNRQVYLYDAKTGKTTLISKASDGGLGNSSSESSFISYDGRFIAFCSGANNLVENDTNNRPDVFVHDTQTNRTKLVSVNSNGVQGNRSNCRGNIYMSKDGRFVTFGSASTNLVQNDTNNAQMFLNVFVHDMQTGKTEIVSANDADEYGNGDSWASGMSPNGKFISFSSEASNLIPNDTNGKQDVFIRKNPLWSE